MAGDTVDTVINSRILRLRSVNTIKALYDHALEEINLRQYDEAFITLQTIATLTNQFANALLNVALNDKDSIDP